MPDSCRAAGQPVSTGWPGAASIPVERNVDVLRKRCTLAGFDERFHAHQKAGPFGAAMVHELTLLAPALVFEEHGGLRPLLLELEAHLAADPVRGPVDHLPKHAPGWLELEDLHVDAA